MVSPIAIAVLNDDSPLCQTLLERLKDSNYDCNTFKDSDTLLEFLQQDGATLPECLLIRLGESCQTLVKRLRTEKILLPAVLFHEEIDSEADLLLVQQAQPFYHNAEILLGQHQTSQVSHSITRAMVHFLERPPLEPLTQSEAQAQADRDHEKLFQRHQNLIDKLKERLGYLGVYYKRDKNRFLRNLPPDEAKDLIQALKDLYREIVLSYFANTNQLNARIDEFVALVFFSDVPVTLIVEMHMELMDEFATQLKLEGRGEDILLDYRLTLIDTIAHLCEMYRRSIPPEP
jgi:circadian clock protein KaiA